MSTRYTFRDKRSVAPADLKPGDCFITKVVAVTGWGDDWTAYEGPADWPDMRVVEHGTKLLEEQAKPLFWVLRMSGRKCRH